jgi:hypothetical protein
MEPEGSLPRLQEPATCPSPPIPLPEEPSQYYRPTYTWAKKYQPRNLNVLDVTGEFLSEKRGKG